MSDRFKVSFGAFGFTIYEDGNGIELEKVLNEFHRRLAALEERADGEDTLRLEQSER